MPPVNELTPTQKQYQHQEFSKIQTEIYIEDLIETLKRLSSPNVWLTTVASLGLLSACVPPPIEATQPPAEVITLEEIVFSPTREITSTVTPEPTATLAPTIEPTADPRDSVPPEWQGKIERIEKLKDGRTVAIADLDPDKEDLLRVLQLNETGEWSPYVPRIIESVIVDGLRDNLYPRGYSELPDLSNFQQESYNNLPENSEITLGYIGKTYLDSEKVAWINWVSGVVIGHGLTEDGYVSSVRVQVPTSTGDAIMLDIMMVYESRMSANVFTLESFGPEIDGKIIEEAGLDQVYEGEMVVRMSQLHRYFIEHQDQVIGHQIIFGIVGGNDEKNYHLRFPPQPKNTTRNREPIINYLQTGLLPKLGSADTSLIYLTFLEGLILDRATIDFIKSYY